ncbi:MAG: hypothetical protein ABI661_06340 [Gammaproteobacteria bacterium]
MTIVPVPAGPGMVAAGGGADCDESLSGGRRCNRSNADTRAVEVVRNLERVPMLVDLRGENRYLGGPECGGWL